MSSNLVPLFQSLDLMLGSSQKRRAKRVVHPGVSSSLASPVSPLPPAVSSPGYPYPNQQQYPQQAPQIAQQYPQLVPQQLPQQYPQLVPQLVPQQEAQNDSVPSIQETRYQSQKEFDTPDAEGNYKSFLTFSNTVPPEVGTQYHVTDQGTASPKFIRSSMYYIPESEKLRMATKLPVSITVHPFAPQLLSEEPIATVELMQNDPIVSSSINESDDDALDKGPLRCHRCRTYINPSINFTPNQKFICNICQFANNTVPQEYYSPLDTRGFRMDKFVKPELHKSVYDLKVPKEYNFNSKDPQPMHMVFLVDISENSVKQNLPTLVAESIRSMLNNSATAAAAAAAFVSDEKEEVGEVGEAQKEGEQGLPFKIAIIAFDKRIHFFNLSPTLERTQVSILSDLDDPFVPFDDGLFVSPEESQFVIEDALNYLEQVGNNQALDMEPAFAAAVKTAGLCLEMHGGGKIISALSSLPSWGPGGLKYKDNRAVGRTPSPEVEKKLFLPDSDYWKAMTKHFIQQSVGMDLFIASHTSVDLSNVGHLVSATGGEISRWTNLNYERDGRLFTEKFKRSVFKTTGYQAQLKLRCSNGLQIAQYYGTSSSLSETNLGGSVQDPVIPILSEDQTFTVLLSYDGLLSKKLDCHFQAALLYTDAHGVRKVRVINLVLAVTSRLEDVFYFTDENAIITTLVRDTLSFIGKQTLNELRESLNTKLGDVFTQYRAMNEYGHNRARTLTNKLLFPDALKNLPLHILSFLKTHAIRASTGLSADSRLAEAFNMLNMPLEKLSYHLYPALVELHSLTEEDGTVDETTGYTLLPRYKDLTASSLDRGVYILCDGFRTWVYVDPDANIMLIKDVFGDQIESIEELDPLIDELPELPSEISQQARNMVHFFNKNIVGIDSFNVQIVRKGIDASEHQFREYLRDDSFGGAGGAGTGGGALRATNGLSYAEYLTNLHKAIRVHLDSDKAANSIRQSISSVEHDTDTLAQRFINF